MFLRLVRGTLKTNDMIECDSLYYLAGHKAPPWLYMSVQIIRTVDFTQISAFNSYLDNL